MYSIKEATGRHSKDIADFQIKMALQTQNLKLDEKLVYEAVDYLDQHKEYGQFYVAEENEQQAACGSLLTTYENKQNWWIESVYVKPEHRRKGNFTNLFKYLAKTAQEKGARSLKLYAEKENQRAKETYKKLGMYCNGQLFYGLDLVYGTPEVKQSLKKPYLQGFSIDKAEQMPGDENLNKCVGKNCELNRGIVCRYEGKVVGYCQIFQQFSDWRFSIIQYVKYLKVDEKYEKEVMDSFKKFLFQSSQLSVGAIRFIVTEQQLVRMKEIDGSLHLEAYDVMALDI